MKRVKNIGMSLVDCQDSLGRISDKLSVLSTLSASFAESRDNLMNKNVGNGMWTILQDMKLEVEEVSESLGKSERETPDIIQTDDLPEGGLVMSKANDKKSHIDKAIDTLTIIAEELKDKETLNKKEIRKLSKILQEAVGDIFYFIGVVPQAIEECYKMTAKHLKRG